MEGRDLDSPGDARLRPARDDDADGVIALIAAVFAEYPGNVLDVDGEEPGLRAPASSYRGFWVVERDRRILGCAAHAWDPDHPAGPTLELKKIYLDRSLRGHGWGRRLIDAAEADATALGARRLVAWSDTRFETAHRVYEALGYRPSGRSRELHDLSNSTELEFVKDVSG